MCPLRLCHGLVQLALFFLFILSEVDLGRDWIHVVLKLHFIIVRLLANVAKLSNFSDRSRGTLDVEVLPRLVLATLFLIIRWRWCPFLVEKASELVAEVSKEISNWT